jgi:hypothetical protein
MVQILQSLIHNIFFISVGVPVMLTLGAAFLEIVTSLAKGRCRGDGKYLVWIEVSSPQQIPASSSSSTTQGRVQVIKKLQQYPNLTINEIRQRSREKIVEIETLCSISITEFNTIGIDLIIGAFSVDIAFMLAHGTNASVQVEDLSKLGSIVFLHLLFLIGILSSVAFAKNAAPDEEKLKGRSSFAAIILGLCSMIAAFYTG